MREGLLVAPGRLRGACAGALLWGLVCAPAAASDLPPDVEAVIEEIFSPAASKTAADVLAAIIAIGDATPTPTPTVTPTPTITPTGTQTRTATMRTCPTAAASVRLAIDNLTAATGVRVQLSGVRREGDCAGGGGLDSYDLTVDCAGQGPVDCATIANLRAGSWVHSVRVLEPASEQVQHRPGLLIAGPAGNDVAHVVFPRVATVTTTQDQGPGSLRDILQTTAANQGAMLIQFDPAAFPPGVPTSIVWLSMPPPLSGSDVTIDAIDATGASGNRILDANARTTAALTVTGAGNVLRGLRLTNAGGNNRDVLSISGAGAAGNLVESCIVDTAATADAIGIDQAGSDFGDGANVIRDCEVRGATDKGIKVTTGSYARIENCWVHGNVNGGIQVTFGARVQAIENLVEDNVGGTAQNGISVLGSTDDTGSGEVQFSQLQTRGNVSRRNGASGLAVRVGADAIVNDDYLAANATTGARIFDDGGAAASAVVQGTTAACNGTDGVLIAGNSTADFGLGARGSTGNNAFTQNNLPAGFENFTNITAVEVFAANSQWEHCGREATCNVAEIERLDINPGGLVEVVPAQAHRAQQPVITGVSRARGSRGDLLRIYGAGFNAIDGHFAEDRCADVAGRNTCVPIRGNCVQIGGVAATVEGVTPTALVVRWPFTCIAPVGLVVRVDQGSSVATSNTVTVCE